MYIFIYKIMHPISMNLGFRLNSNRCVEASPHQQSILRHQVARHIRIKLYVNISFLNQKTVVDQQVKSYIIFKGLYFSSLLKATED